MGCNDCRAAPSEQVEDNAVARRYVLDCIGDQLHGFDGGMKFELIHAARLPGVGTLVLPHIGAVAPELPELEGVDVRRCSAF